MTERPILFSGPMVRAILAGTKTQTRRVMKPQPVEHGRIYETSATTEEGHQTVGHSGRWLCEAASGADDCGWSCPYGVPGDRLWVRETFRQGAGSMSVHYAADPDEVSGGPWRPSIFMPRWASRLTLEVTEVRVQRLQDISEEDAEAEGVEPYTGISPGLRVPGPGFNRARLGDQPHRLPFADLWDSINGKRATWNSNPWCWAITFKRVA